MDVIDFHEGTSVFYIDMESGSDKTTYKGQFKVKCVLSPLEYVQADSFYRELLGKHNPHLVSEYVGQLCYALSQIKYRVMEYPAWFKGNKTGMLGDIDDTILLYVLDKIVDAEAKYREGIEERYNKARESVKKAMDDGSLKKSDSNQES